MIVNLRAAEVILTAGSNTDVAEYYLYETRPYGDREVAHGTNPVFTVKLLDQSVVGFYFITKDKEGKKSERSDVIELSPKMQRPSIKLTHTESSSKVYNLRRHSRMDGGTNVVVTTEGAIVVNTPPRRILQPVTLPPPPLPVSTNKVIIDVTPVEVTTP